MKKSLLTLLLFTVATISYGQKNGTYRAYLSKVEVQGIAAESSSITILEHQNYSATGIDDLENPKINFNLKSISK